MTYRLARWISKLLVSLFHRRVALVGVEHVPAAGPLVVCANHFGSLVDPMVLLAGIPRRLRPVAKATLFSRPLVRRILDALGALPVYRPQDRHLVQGSNEGFFAATSAALARGECILIFPEGISKSTPVLSPLRPGAARMALEAEAANGWRLGVKLLPVGIHLDGASWFRRGKVLVNVGAPLEAVLEREAHEPDPEEAVRALTARLESALRSLVVEAETQEELALLRIAVRAWAHEKGERLDGAAEVEVARSFAAGYRRIARERPAEALQLRTTIETYARTLEHFRLTGNEVDLRYGFWTVLTWLLGEGTLLLVGAPLGLAGMALNAFPFWLVGVVAGRFSDGEDLWASLKLAVGFVVFPLWWAAVACAALAAVGVRGAMLALVACPLAGLWALRFRDRQQRFRRQVRAFLLLAGGTGLARHLRESRRTIFDEIERLGEALAAPERGPEDGRPPGGPPAA